MTLADVGAFVGVVAMGGSFIFACVRLGMAAGGIRENLKGLITQVTTLSDRLGSFAEKAEERLADHGERLAALEALRPSHFHARDDD